MKKFTLLLIASTVVLYAAGISEVKAQQPPFVMTDSIGKVGSILEGKGVRHMVFGKIDLSTSYDDLLIAFTDNSASASNLKDSVALFKNDGDGNFTWKQNLAGIDELKNTSIAWSKKDGRILVTGQAQSDGAYVTKLFAKNGSGVYEELTSPLSTGTLAGTAGGNLFADFNGDALDDIVLWNTNTGESHIYLQQSTGEYTEVANPVDGTATFPALMFNGTFESSITTFDYNKDGKADILVAGRTQTTNGTSDNVLMSRIYKSNGDGTFTYIKPTLDGVANTPFQGVGAGSITALDIDGDGYATDIAITGNANASTGYNKRRVIIYKQDAADVDAYTTLYKYVDGGEDETQYGGRRYGQVLGADLDGDGKKNDIIVTGQLYGNYLNTDVFIKLPSGSDSLYRMFTSSNSLYYSASVSNKTPYSVDKTMYDNITGNSGYTQYYKYFTQGDINGDGMLDIAYWGYRSNYNTTFLSAILKFDESTLPVELTDFTAKVTSSNTVDLSWTTLSETNSSSFEIERSVDGKNFTTIGFQKAAGNSNSKLSYIFTDNTPLEGTNVYRIKEIDLDGTVTYSDVVSVKIQVAASMASIYPNPVAKGASFNVKAAGSVKITTLSGQVILTKSINGSTAIPTLGWTSGLYLVNIYDTAGKVVSSNKLIVQ